MSNHNDVNIPPGWDRIHKGDLIREGDLVLNHKEKLYEDITEDNAVFFTDKLGRLCTDDTIIIRKINGR